MGFLVLGNPKQRQVSTTRNLMDTDYFHEVNLHGYSMFLPRKPDEYMCMQDTTKNETCECIFTLIGYACPYMHMHVTSQLFSPAHSPSELAPMHVQPLTLQDLLLVAQALDASCIYSIFSKNGFSYEYHYQLTALYLKMLALCVPKMTALFACGKVSKLVAG